MPLTEIFDDVAELVEKAGAGFLLPKLGTKLRECIPVAFHRSRVVFVSYLHILVLEWYTYLIFIPLYLMCSCMYLVSYILQICVCLCACACVCFDG